MAQYQELKRKRETVQQAAKHDVPPPLSINLPKISNLPNKNKPWSEAILPVDILLLTVEDCEFLACYAYIRNSFKTYQRNLGYVYFGNMGESEEEPLKVALIKCSEGSSVPGGSQTVTTNAVMQLRPKVVYSVGCCMGLNPEDTKLGDVVISSKLTTAEASKIPVGREISNLIKHAADGWNPPLKSPEGQEVQVHRDSEILSGIHPDSAKRRRVSHSEAIASESQGKGEIFIIIAFFQS